MGLSIELLSEIVESHKGWEAALLDAEEKIAETEKRAAQLRATASVIRKKIAAGEPWPGKSKAA